jgi:hypothetical protein
MDVQEMIEAVRQGADPRKVVEAKFDPLAALLQGSPVQQEVWQSEPLPRSKWPITRGSNPGVCWVAELPASRYFNDLDIKCLAPGHYGGKTYRLSINWGKESYFGDLRTTNVKHAYSQAEKFLAELGRISKPDVERPLQALFKKWGIKDTTPGRRGAQRGWSHSY